MTSVYRYALMEERLRLGAVLDAPIKGCKAMAEVVMRMPSLAELKEQGGRLARGGDAHVHIRSCTFTQTGVRGIQEGRGQTTAVRRFSSFRSHRLRLAFSPASLVHRLHINRARMLEKIPADHLDTSYCSMYCFMLFWEFGDGRGAMSVNGDAVHRTGRTICSLRLLRVRLLRK